MLMTTLKIKTTRFFDGERLHAEQPFNITVRGNRVAEVSGQTVAGDPFQDLRVLAEPETHLKLVIRGGEIVLNRLMESQS